MSSKEEEKDNNTNDNNENNNLSNDNLETSIKQVLKRKRISVVKPKEDQILDFVTDDLEGGSKAVENPKLLFYFLSNTPIFKQYVYINNFSQENLINSFRFGKYIKLKKDTILFKQGDKTDYFYLVLSGCIGFILTTYDDNILKINPFSREVNSIRVGAFFGEWGLIYKINRTVSAYAKEDTLLLGFDRFTFKTFYQDNIILSESYCKKFVLKHIKSFKSLNETSFSSYYREIKKIFCIPGKQIFCEGGEADSFYLVYMGSCVVKKGLNNLIIKDSGDFIGIESLFNDKYETSIYPYSDGTVLLRFLLNSFNDIIVDNLKSEFESYYKNQKKIIKISCENYNKYKDKYQMNFINIIENLKKNKVENRKNINKINIEEIRIIKNDIPKKQYSSPYKVTKFCDLSTVNGNKIQNNRLDSSNINTIKSKIIYDENRFLNQFKSTNDSHINFNNNLDINNSKFGFNYEKQKIRNNEISINNNIYYKNKDKNIRPYSSLYKNNNVNKYNLHKRNYKYFYEEESPYNVIPKKIKLDNHFSSQNFKINRKKPKTSLSKKRNKLNKTKSINSLENKTKKLRFEPIYVKSKNYAELNNNLGGKIKSLKNKFCQSEQRLKIIKNNENQKNYETNNESNIEIPLMIIRNVSFYSPKLK